MTRKEPVAQTAWGRSPGLMLGRVGLGLILALVIGTLAACGETEDAREREWRCTLAAINCYRQCERYRCYDFVRCDRTCIKDAGCPALNRGVVPPLRAC